MSEKIKIDPEEIIKQRIYVIRGYRVMLDSDLAELYRVETKNLNKAVKRNLERFPVDFMFQLTVEEYSNRFQIGTGSHVHRNIKYLPYAFTEHGVAMLSSVLRSEIAVQMNILIIRVFIKVKELVLSNKDLEIRIGEVEKKQKEHGDLLKSVHAVVKHLLEPPPKPKGKMGFQEKK
ncbi:MAG: hypothetical protein QG640_696 [Patescibacteria group bacterium]|nr:hypothetical protein [Patescibacteria group bacterium]